MAYAIAFKAATPCLALAIMRAAAMSLFRETMALGMALEPFGGSVSGIGQGQAGLARSLRRQHWPLVKKCPWRLGLAKAGSGSLDGILLAQTETPPGAPSRARGRFCKTCWPPCQAASRRRLRTRGPRRSRHQ
jgi:hypothetical protein